MNDQHSVEAEIARIIREVEQGGRYIHGMMPEAAARAIINYLGQAEVRDALTSPVDGAAS